MYMRFQSPGAGTDSREVKMMRLLAVPLAMSVPLTVIPFPLENFTRTPALMVSVCPEGMVISSVT